MKTLIYRSLRRQVCAGLVIFGIVCSVALPALAGLTMELNVIRYHQYGYYFYPNLTTNNTAPAVPFGDYFVTSSGYPTNGSWSAYHYDTNGFNQHSGGSSGYGDFDGMNHELTNGTWSVYVTNIVMTNVYHFSVTANIDSNSLPLVTILFPTDGAVNSTNQPTFFWQGPTNYGGLVVYEYNGSANLPVTQTNWSSPRVLYQGRNDFTAHYDSNSITAVISSVPLDDASNAISSWVSTTHLQDYVSSSFSVGVVDPSGTGHTLIAHYPWDGTNSNGTASGVDSSGHGYDLNFGGGYGALGGDNSIVAAAAGSRAIQFHNGDGNSAGYVGWEPTPTGLLAALSGSFSISCWIKTTQNFAWDDAPANYGAGIISADNGGQAHDLIPLALTGSKIAFNTGGDSEDVTMNSAAPVNDGNYHHVVVTRNQSTGQKVIYIDGVLDSFASGSTNLLNDPEKLTIGALADAGNPDANDGSYYNGFDGAVDDLQIYTGVLSAGEVANLFVNPGSTVTNGGGFVGGHRSVAHYAFDDSNNLGHDSSGNGNDMSGPTWWGPVHQFNADAEAGSGAVQFFGTSEMNAQGQSLINLNAVLAGSFTFSAWVKTTVTNGADYNNAFYGGAIFWAYNDHSYTNDTIPLSITGNKAAFTTRDQLGNDNTLHSASSVNDGSYHLITVTRDQATGEKKIYVDGDFETSELGTTEPLNGNDYNLTLGGYAYILESTSTVTNYSSYRGLLDDVQIYSGVLSSPEIASLFANPGSQIPDVIGQDFSGALNTTDLTWNTGGAAPWFRETTNTYDGGAAAQSGRLTDSQTNWLQTTVPANGSLSFYWKVSSEDGFDLLHFYLNGNEQDTISGEVDWTQKAYAVSAGDTLRWEYTKDDNSSNGLDAGFLDQVSYFPNNSQNFNAALGTTNWNYTVTGNSQWFTENTNTHDGYFAVQNGSLTNGQTATLQTTITGPGTLSFWFWSAISDYYQNGFYLSFALDGNEQTLYSGFYFGGWGQDVGIAIPPGQHTLAWTAQGGDTATAVGFLDQVSLSSDYAPFITSGPVDGTVSGAGFNYTIPVKLGSNTVLVAQLAGSPAPTIRWYRNGTLLTNATSATLTVTNTQFSDAGYYQLTASNYLGTVSSSSVFLKVYQETDLQPLTFSVPPVVSSGALIPMLWTATNTGPASFSNFYDYIEFSAPVVTPGYTVYSVGSTYRYKPVAAASIYTATNGFRLAGIPAGNYSLVLKIDSNNDIIETSETNNILTNAPITVINPDLQPGNLQVASIANLGNTTIQFTYNLTNNGPGILDGASFYDELFLSTNATYDASAIAIRQINQAPTIGGGSCLTTTNSFTVPIVPSGNYYLILHVDHYGFQDVGYVWETSETNNYAVVPIHILQSDLVPTNLVAPAVVSSRQPVQIGWNDLNQGDGLATNTTFFLLYDDLYLSTNQSINASSIKLGNNYYSDFNGYQYYYGDDFYWNIGIAPGQTRTNLQNVIIPNVSAGNYFLVLSVDANNAIREITETNNTLAIPIALGTLDLLPTAFTAPAAANTRSTIPVTWAVTNQGTGTVYPAWVDRVFISTNSFLSSSAVLLGEFARNNSLTGGTSYTTATNITLNGTGAGNYYLLFYTDAATNVVDLNRSNNVVALPLTINSPDLLATTLTVAPSFSSQQPMSAVYSVSNASSVTAYGGWSDRLFLSPDGILETNNQLLFETIQAGDLAGNTGYSQLANSGIPAVPAGDYFALLQANANQFFTENNPGNNLLAKPVHIHNPDLVLTNFAAPSTIVLTQYNQSFEADWSVLNQGTGDAYVGWSDYLYLSRTNVLDTNAVYIGSANQNPVLGSGQSYLSFANGQLPDGIQGNYYLLLQANDYRSLFESTYTNNLAVRPVSLVVPPVPVLSVVTVDSPADAWSGQQIYVTWTLTNSGSAAVSGSFYDVVYLCSSAIGASPQIYGAFQFSGQILPGQSIVRQQKISLPINLQGTFWVALQTDYNRSIFEFTYRTNEFLVASHPMVVHLTPTPNLTIASIGAPTNMFSGGEGTISWVETNNGVGPTSASFWDDAVYLCDTTNFFTANYRVFLGAPNNVAYLNPGDSYASSANVALPRGIAGTFYFIVWADSGNHVYEWTNENDNMIVSAPVFVSPSPTPDLQVTTVQPPHDAFSGQPVFLKYAETNFGLGQTQPSEIQWYDRVYISTNVTLDSSAKYLGDLIHNGGLTPAAGYEGTNTLTLPVGVSGDWYFIISGDIFNQVYEAAFEDNNARTAAYVTHIALTPPPDLVTTIAQAPTSALTSHTLAVTYTVANNGTTITPNSGWNDNLYLWTGSVFDDAHATYLTSVPHYGALQPGAAYTNTFYVVLPADRVGTNYIFVRSDAYNAVFELDKTNNLTHATNPVVIEFRPSDLAVTALTAPLIANAGAGILVNWAVTNRGAGDTAVPTWNDRLILSQNILPGAPSDVQLVQIQHNGLLGANGSYTVNNQLAQVPSYVPAGNYQLFLVADVGNNVPVETNWNNNVYGPVPITITAHSPDLRVVSATGPASALSGSTVTVNWTETNAGDLPANASYWYDTVYLSPDGLLGPSAIPLGYRQNVRSLLPGQSYTNFLSAALPINVQSNYYFVVVADGYNYIPEAGTENNNTYVINPPVFITLAAVPDLAVTDVIAPTNAFAGQNFHLSWVVKNIGSTNANSAWYDVAYLSADQILDANLDTYLGYAYQNHNLAPGENYTNSADFPIPQGLAGPFYVFLTTDPSHSVNERGQLTNNTAYNSQAMLVQLLPPVDLVAGQVTIPVNAVPGQNMTVSYTVQNQGSNTALGSWTDSLFVSADTNWDIGDKLFARVTHNGDVPPDGSYTGVVTAPLPGVLPGDYHVIIRSDILNHLSEGNKSNNIAASLNSAAIDVQRLTFATPAGNTLGLGQSAFYKFDATNGQTIHLQFTSSAPLSANELFVQFGQMPDSGNFMVAANEPFVANPQIYLAATNTGTYYVLAKCNYAATPAAYTLLAEVLPFTVREVQPNISGNVGNTTFFVRGALFDTNTQFALQQPNRTINAQRVYLANSTAAYVTFNMNGTPDGEWNFLAAMTDSASNSVATTLTNAVVVGSTDPVEPSVSIDGPLAVREPSFGYVTHSCLVDYGNSGYSDLAPPLILVSGKGGTTLGTTLNNLQAKPIQLLGRSLVGPPEILRPQSQASKLIYYRGGDTHLEVWTLAADSTRQLAETDWQDIENSVRPAGITDGDWLNFWVNIRPRLGNTWGDYVQFLGRVAKNFPAEQREVSAMFLSLYTNSPGFRASASFSGTLLGAIDGLPQSNMELDLMTLSTSGYDGKIVARAQTDLAGKFNFPYLAPGKYYYAVADRAFDMDRDGSLDPNLASFQMTNTDVLNQLVYLHQPPTNTLTTVTNDQDAQLVLDSQNVLHSFWYRNGALWHAWKNQAQWVDAGVLASNILGSFGVAASPKLLNGSNPGIIAAWPEARTNSIQIIYSVGRPGSGGGYQWSTPSILTDDSVAQNASPAITVDENGRALVTYLKIGPGAHDDSDVYFSTVTLSSGTLNWNSITPSLIQAYDFTGGGAASDALSFGYKKEFKHDLGSYDLGFTVAFGLKGGVAGCQANAAGSASVSASASTPQLGLTVSGELSEKFAWQINPEQCAWEFKSATVDGTAKLDLQLKGALSLFLNNFLHPVPRAIGAGIDKMTDWARGRGVLLENSVGIGFGLGLQGVSWTHPPAPITEWRTPDTFGKAIFTVNSTLALGVKGVAKADEVARYQDGGESYNYIEKGANTNGSTDSLALEGKGKIEAIFEIYPSPHIRSLIPSGEIKLSWSPFFSYTYPIAGTPLIIDHIATGPTVSPRGGSGSDPLPEGWYFNYDPASFVGTTNVYGSNSVLGNVASDRYQDGAPALGLDTNGTPFQVWYKFVDPYAAQAGSQIYAADFNGTNWNAPAVIPGSIGLNSYVSVALDSEGHRLAVWVHGDSSGVTTNLNYDQFNTIRSSNDVCFAVFDGTAWSPTESVGLTAGMDADLRVSRLDSGDLLATWIYTDTAGVQRLVSSQWDGKGWSSITEITSGLVGAPASQQVGGVTYLFWNQEINTNRNQNLFVSQNSGAGWSAPVPFSPALLPSAPAPSVVSARITDTQLEAIQVVREKQHKACCKCDQGVKNQDATPNVGCGIASIDYNYETCHKIFTYQPCQVRPSDPNNIVGPEGFGPERWVPAGVPLDYLIQFENDPVLASAPATRVTITLPLDDHFDPRTVRLGDFGFGGLIFNIPPGRAFYQTRLDLSATKGYYVDLIAGVDVVNRQAFWTLTTIDPATGDVPRNALVGFLPPNLTPPEGDGFVSCAITPLAGVTNGSLVTAKATIVFDNQPPMDTPSTFNTLQTAQPASSVLPLPVVSLNPTFDVAWQGVATAGGSGISSYDIYASENGAGYYPWLQGTTLDHAPFAGQPGGTYAFYSLAHDHVGNVQMAPTNADAITFVSSNLPPVIGSITNVVIPPDNQVSVRVKATDLNGDKLTYSLVSAPTGAVIGTTNGWFRWRPSRLFAATTNYFTVAVTDNGVPPLGTNQTFAIIVQDFLELSLGETNLEGGQTAFIPISLASNEGATNLLFTVQVPEDVLTNWTIAATSPQIGTASLQDLVTNLLITVNTTPGQSLQGTQQISTLTFSAVTNQVSGFITLPITSVTAAKPGGTSYANYLTRAGTVIVVQNEPLMRARLSADQSRSLLLYGKLGTDYQVLFNTNLSLSAGWQTLLTYTQTNGVITLPLGSTNPVIFYRLAQP